LIATGLYGSVRFTRAGRKLCEVGMIALGIAVAAVPARREPA